MLSILDTPPVAIRAELADLRDALDAALPLRAVDRNLLIATWNIRALGDLTAAWEASEEDSPKRDLHSLLCIGEILSRFDVIAIQEAKANLTCLRELLRWLGPPWRMIMTDVTRGDPGNGERLAFLFDTRKVQLAGLAAELVLPKEVLEQGVTSDALQEQFARTPYAVTFQAGTKTFTLVTLHVLYGDQPGQRTGELYTIAQWLADWARDKDAADRNLIALGDFNIDRLDDERYRAFTATGLTPPTELNDAPRTIFESPAGKFYDQIAWFIDQQGIPELSLTFLRAGFVDFVPHVLRDRGLSRSQLSWRISDHYPLWAEFLLRDWL